MSYEGPLNSVNAQVSDLEKLKKRVLEFKPRETVDFEGRKYMIVGIDENKGSFKLQELEPGTSSPVGDVLEGISPHKVQKIEQEISDLPEANIELLDEEEVEPEEVEEPINKAVERGAITINKELNKRVLEFRPREIVQFQGKKCMITGINEQTGQFNLQELEGKNTLVDVDPFAVEKIEELEEDRVDPLAAK